MLSVYIENLRNSIHWAQYQDDFDVLCLAKRRMDQLMEFASQLSVDEQQKVQKSVDDVLPMEWPLWMEACRYGDCESHDGSDRILH